ncbi:MAG: YraN family protein [bacterium]|nr:YraN family protein [bacterium]
MKLLQRLFVRPPLLHKLKPGDAGEEWVSYLYRQRGCKILARNYAVFGQKKLGELDIVCRLGRRIIIVEVKTRSSERFMSLEETINIHKQRFLRRMAKIFIQQNPKYDSYELQIDVAGVLMEPLDNSIKSVKIIENAIEDSV